MSDWLPWILPGGLLLLLAAWLAGRARRAGLDRLHAGQPEAPEAAPPPEEPGTRTRRRHLPELALRLGVSLACGLLGAFLLSLMMPASLGLLVAFGILVALSTGVLFELSARQVQIRVEVQLAEALDMAAASLRAGAAPTQALEQAFREAPRGLARKTRDLMDRLRVGEPPLQVFARLEERLPLEGVRLLRLALAAHWQGGGALAPTLASVARTTRDRVALARRIQAQSAEGRWSVVGILAVTYMLAVLLTRQDPARMEDFLQTSVGDGLVLGAVILQSLGVLWMARITRLEV